MPLRIATLVEQFWHRVPGGTARATEETLRALTATGRIDPRPVAAWHRPTVRRLAPDGVGPIRTVPMPRPALYESWIRLNRPSVERWTGEVDVTWASSMIPIPSSAPLVATVHDLEFLANPLLNSARGRSFFPRAWAAVRDRASVIVCPSQVVADDCGERGVEPAKLRVVPWGVGAPACPPGEADGIRAALGLPESFVLWVGTVEPRKNLPRLVDAMMQVDRDLAFAVVGPDGWVVDGDDALGRLGGRARRLGRVDEVQLSALYHTATVFALPSLAEGFGLPVLEAMAHRTPVVTSRETATEEVAGGAALLVDPTDPAAIADAIETAARGGSSTMQRIERGVARAAELTWANTAIAYERVFAEAAGGRR